MDDFARISKIEITILENIAEINIDIDPKKAQQALEID